MKPRRFLFLPLASVLLLAACTTLTQRKMKEADAALMLSWRKSRASDWDGSLLAARQSLEHVRQGIEARPVRRGVGGADVDLRPLMSALASGPARDLEIALQSHNPVAAESAYPMIQAQCTNCHTVLGKPQIQLSQLAHVAGL